MYLSRKRIRNIFVWGIGIVFLFLAFLYSDYSMVGFSDFKFLSGSTEVDTLHIELTWGDTTGFSVIIYNKEETGMEYRVWFVDAGITNDAFAQAACLGQHETSQFGNYVTGDTSLFTIAASGSQTKMLSVTFPTYYSGLYHGCIMFYPAMNWITSNTSSGEVTTDMNTLPRRWVFINALVHPSSFPVIVQAFSSNRVYQTTNNANNWVLKVYDSGKNLISTSPIFTLNDNGTGEALINAPAWTYYMVFKWQSHLASYLSWISIGGTGGEFLDFTTGTDLYNTQQLNDAQDDGNRYQSAGDLKNMIGKYDHTVNGNDIAILTADGFQESGIGVLDPRNLNADGAVNVSDISVIWVNFEKTDPFFGNTIFSSITTR